MGVREVPKAVADGWCRETLAVALQCLAMPTSPSLVGSQISCSRSVRQQMARAVGHLLTDGRRFQA